MAQYKFKAVDLQGKKHSGIRLANDENELASQLSREGMFLSSASVMKEGKKKSSFWSLSSGKVKLSETTAFCRQFAIMITAGIPIVASLDLLKTQSYSQAFRNVLAEVSEDVKGGFMLSEALSKHKKVFPVFFRSMVKVGESSGQLDTVLNSLADYYEKDTAIRRKTKSAFAYPIFLLVLTFGISLAMLLYIIPTSRSSLSSMDIEITGYTAAVYSLSDFISEDWFILLGSIAGVFFLWFIIGKTPGGRYAYDYLKVHLPGFRKVNINLATARFARGFGLLLSSGMNITEAMDTISIIFTNKYQSKCFKLACDEIRQGVELAVAFKNYKLFPDILIQMIAVGERTATLDKILLKTCSFYDSEVESALNGLVGKIQPTLLIIMGIIVGGLFLATYSPMISIMQSL